MSINFNEKDLLLIYGHFTKKIKELEKIKSTPGNPIDEKNINQDIELFSSITQKIEGSNPNISNLKNYL